MKIPLQMKVNGTPYRFEVEPRDTLLEVLRDKLRLMKTKEGCSLGECCSCTVILNRKSVNSCLVLAMDCDQAEILTAEGLAGDLEYRPFNDSLIGEGAMRVSFDAPGAVTQKEVFSFCHVCPGRCAVKVVIENGKVVDMKPDKESGLPNEQCPVKKGRHSIPEVLAHPDRLTHPLKRVGARGEGKWQQISWDEALDTIAQKMLSLKAAYGPQSVMFGLGEPKGLEFAFAQRLATVWGTPNIVTPAWYCGIPSGHASAFTYGWNCVPDEETLPKLIVMWGVNNNFTSGGMRRESFERVLDSGAKVIVVDPRRIDMAAVADLWVRVRPSSDGVLAMGLLKVIVDEKLYDEKFVKEWCIGFDQLVEELKNVSLREVEAISWVPQETVKQFARLYATTKPASIQWGNGLDTCANAFSNSRAIAILRAITGNLNIPGGDLFLTPAPFLRPGKFFLLSKFPKDFSKSAGKKFRISQRALLMPSHCFNDSVLSQAPERIRAALFILTNPVISYPDSKKTYEVFQKLEFTVVSEIFMTPTAAMADIVLPVAWGMERDEVGYWPGWYEEMRAYPKLVDPPGEAWPDTKWMNELAKRLGLGEHFWEHDEEAIDEFLKPSGLNYEEMKLQRALHHKTEYKPHDYRTPSGKVEIASQRAVEFGYSAVPTWKEVTFMPELTDEYPLLMTNGKDEVYMGTGYKHVASLRVMKAEPCVEMHPATAEKFGLEEGQMVWIETPKGRVTQRLALDDHLDPRVIITTFGWWYPESSHDMYAWDKHNINVLTTSGPPYDSAIGTTHLRGVPCRVSPVVPSPSVAAREKEAEPVAADD
jgi:anaerobic selenocysteine-containing dehydrogenase